MALEIAVASLYDLIDDSTNCRSCLLRFSYLRSTTDSGRDASSIGSPSVVIMLLKMEKDDGWELEDYRPITLLNAERKILLKMLTESLMSVIEILLEMEQNWAVKD